jgi:predicted deacylase
MLAEAPARSIRVGGVNVAPGEARTLGIPLSPRPAQGDAAQVMVPAWVGVGPKAGPRVSVVAAVRGYEALAARSAAELRRGIDPAAMAGSLLVVPVLRPGGIFRGGGRPAPAWSFPGDAGATRRARDAFILFSEVTVGSTVLLVLGAAPPGRRGLFSVRGDLADPRTRRLALETGATAALSTRGRPGSLLAAAAGAGVTALELRAGGALGREAADVDELVAAVRAVLTAIGLLAPHAKAIGGDAKSEAKPDAKSDAKSEDARPRTRRPAATGPLLIGRAFSVRAPCSGLIEPVAVAGQIVRRGGLLARIVAPLAGKPVEVVAPCDGLVLESPLRPAESAKAKLYVVGALSRTDATRAAATAQPLEPAASTARVAGGDAKLRIGWVERIALPNLGITRLKAKIDTGARTSALHVARMKVVDTAGGPGRRPILEIVVPGGLRGTRPIKVRAAVREYVVVRDTSGRMEKRPVIETALQLGPFTKRILVTLTNRGDMLFPMLIGRTALGPGIVVDPSRRYLLSIS